MAWPLLLSLAMLLAACATPTPAATPTPGPAVRGAELFAATCATCHGTAGDGSPGVAPALDASGHAWHHPDGQLRDWISRGKLGLGSRMPGYGDQLGEDGIEAVLAYVHTLWTDEQRRAQRDVSERYEEGTRRIRGTGTPTATQP